MFHKGERLISPSHMLLGCSVSVRQRGTIDSQHTVMEEMSSCRVSNADAHKCTNLHGGGDVGEGEALEVGQQARGEDRRLWCVCGRGRN